MNAEAMRIAIAEACPGLFIVGRSVFDLPHLYWKKGGAYQGPSVDPLSDLNACAEFEKTLSDEEHKSFRIHLWAVTTGGNNEGYEEVRDSFRRAFVSATAEQRCIAFLKTKGLYQ